MGNCQTKQKLYEAIVFTWFLHEIFKSLEVFKFKNYKCVITADYLNKVKFYKHSYIAKK